MNGSNHDGSLIANIIISAATLASATTIRQLTQTFVLQMNTYTWHCTEMCWGNVRTVL